VSDVESPTTRAPEGTGIPPGRICAIAGFGLAGFAVWIFPYVLAPVALVLGVIALRRGEQLGKWVIVAAVVGFALGLLIAALPTKFVT
jgi:hypothetical protein